MKRPDETGQPDRAGTVPEAATPLPQRKEWVAPKLEFVEPKLTMHGDLQRLTGAFFGTFSP